ncbi:hypothetical protein J7337_001900 [Fusarium musae]|uniref:Uncharacterized protein n=1 Tax=Fusarium musae TaxID=1042133 RepID=A0A9P8DVF7_9HYPO|nr:hypothetical protein J7337_001900 [Fusarium musae]KAG9508336.1 hypothetical protein J7337_001900 [Fusarium musae]
MTQLAKLLIILAAASATLSAPTMRPRQLAGEGSFFDSVFSGTDNGVGYGVENAEDNAASLLGDKAADLVQTDGDNIDGQLTQDAATLGGQIVPVGTV